MSGYESRRCSRIYCEAKIPCTIYSGAQFYDRIEIKNALSYLRMIAYKD